MRHLIPDAKDVRDWLGDAQPRAVIPGPPLLYVELPPHEHKGDFTVYQLNQQYFPGARVLLGPALDVLPRDMHDRLVDLCRDVCRLNASPEERARLTAIYWPDPPRKPPTLFYKSNHGGTP